MAKHLCSPDNAAAPVPFVGLYIIVATLVCFSLMLHDVIRGIYLRKTWLPCRFFGMNSATLTLLSVAAKLPVDLTTPMPSAYDQLSKLTGTAMLCVSMGFLFPSLGSNGPSECMTNMVSMTIFVVTIIVNICIQMSTGIIFSFIPELAIVMFCMLTILIRLWLLTWAISIHKELEMDRKKDLLAKGTGSMLQRLKLCYLHGYDSEPQFALCKQLHVDAFILIPGLVCLVVVLEATFRSFISHELEFCDGQSDYGWSMRYIILTQILVILLASLANGFRKHVNLYTQERFINIKRDVETLEAIKSDAPHLKAYTGDCLYLCFMFAIAFGNVVTRTIFYLPQVVVQIIYAIAGRSIEYCCTFFVGEKTELQGNQEYVNLLEENGLKLKQWTLTKCVKNIKRLTNGSYRSDSSSHLGKLLLKRPPSHQSLEQLNRKFGFTEGNEASCLYVVFIVKVITSISQLSTLGCHLIQSLSEVYDIIYFIDTKMNSSRSNYQIKRLFAKAMWKGDGLNALLSEGSQSSSVNLRICFTRPVCNELRIILDLISNREHTSAEDVYDYLEELLVDILHIFLMQLPLAIFKELMECNAEEYEETAGRMLKLLCRIKHLESRVQWKFPVGSNISSLITSQASDTSHHNDSDVVASHVTEVEDDNVLNAHPHEIIQVE